MDTSTSHCEALITVVRYPAVGQPVDVNRERNFDKIHRLAKKSDLTVSSLEAAD
jgi:hypothetical protein